MRQKHNYYSKWPNKNQNKIVHNNLVVMVRLDKLILFILLRVYPIPGICIPEKFKCMLPISKYNLLYHIKCFKNKLIL